MSFRQRDGYYRESVSAYELSDMIEDELHISPNGVSEDIDKVTFIFDHDLPYYEMNKIRDIMNRMDYTEI